MTCFVRSIAFAPASGLSNKLGYSVFPLPLGRSVHPPLPAHRFVLTRYEGGVAFDTQTGQICRTWDWQPAGKTAKQDPQTGLTPQHYFGELAPTCISVYQQYASGTNPQSEEIPDEQPSS